VEPGFAPAAAPSEVAAPALPATDPPAPPEAAPSGDPAARPPVASTTASKDAAAVASVAPRGHADLGTLEEYQKAIRIVAARYKRYPRVAIDNNWEGSVVVRVAIGPSGAVDVLAVRVSTGYDVLDRVALDMVRQAAPQVPIPAALRGKEFSAEIRVIFSLLDGA
jgi:protein TonB